MSQTTQQSPVVDTDGRIRVPCPRCTLPVAVRMPRVEFPGDELLALTRVSAAVRLHVVYGCTYS